MNIVLIVTDTQCKWMVGAYGHPEMKTPHLDRLAAEGMRFERAYPATPVCTPARGALFTGRHPMCNGAYANELTPHRQYKLMGEILRHYGIRAPYTGKWHLDGTGYNGTGEPDGGFEPDWWFDRSNMLRTLSPEIRDLYRQSTTADELRQAGFSDEHAYGHQVANRAIDFLGSEHGAQEPFVLTVCFDEPHDPWMCPPQWWEMFEPGDIPGRPNYGPAREDKPAQTRLCSDEIIDIHGALDWDGLVAKRLKFFGCNSFIDSQVGRIMDAVDRHYPDDTLIIYTADHGDQLGSHGVHDKGPYLYEESSNVPFIVRGPGVPAGTVSDALVSQIDLLPTILATHGIERPEVLQGVDLSPAFRDPQARVRDHVLVSFNRFCVTRFADGGFYPIRAMVDGRCKLIINLLDSDELYDLEDDPYELTNLIDDPDYAERRDALHDALLEELYDIRDPMWTPAWKDRPWRRNVERTYFNGRTGSIPANFDW